MLIDSLYEYFDEANIALFDKFVPFYASSICCHLANLENYEREFFIRHGKVENLRLHMFFVAPPGFSKSLIMRKFLSGPRAALADTDIDIGFESLMTEASYVGTIKRYGKKVKVTRGAAWEYRESLMAVDEFSVLSNTMTLDYGKTLDSALLTSLDDGYLVKRLADGKIKYVTQLTLWAGSQPLRFDLSSGIGRRLFFIYFIPTKEEEEKIKNASRSNSGNFVSKDIIEKISKEVEIVKENLSKIEDVEFTDNFYDFLDEQDVPHYEETLFRRLALGYVLSRREDVEENLVIDINEKLKELISSGAHWRREIKKGPDVSQVVNLLKDRGVMSLSDLKNKLTDFGMSYKQATKCVSELYSTKVIDIRNDTKADSKSMKSVVTLSKF